MATGQTLMRSSSALRWVLGLTSVASLMVALDTLVVSTALTTIRLDLGASIEALEWIVNAYNLTLAVLLLPAAALGDRFGRRRAFAAGLGIFVAASAASALAPDVGWLIVARAAQGVGAALVLTLALTIVSEAFPAQRRGWAIGILEGITGLAVVGGPVLGGAVAQGIAWEWIFWLNVPIGLAVIPLALTRIQESFGGDTALDLCGASSVVVGDAGVVLGVLVVAGQQPPGAVGHDRGRPGGAGEGLHRGPVVEGHDGDELGLVCVTVAAAQDVHAAKARERPIEDAGNDGGVEQPLVGVGVVAGRPAVPDAQDHREGSVLIGGDGGGRRDPQGPPGREEGGGEGEQGGGRDHGQVDPGRAGRQR